MTCKTQAPSGLSAILPQAEGAFACDLMPALGGKPPPATTTAAGIQGYFFGAGP